MCKTIKTILLLLASSSIVVFVILGLGVDIFHTFEELFYDHQATIFTNSAFSRLTNKSCLFCGLISLFCIPFYILKLCKKDYVLPKMIYSLKYVATILIIIVFLMVVLILFPATWILEGFASSIRTNFYGDCLYAHVLIPFIFVLSFLSLDEKTNFSKREEIATYIILGVYILMYVFFVFVFKTWEDFYFINTIISYVTIFGFIGITFLLIPIPFLLNKFIYKIKSK